MFSSTPQFLSSPKNISVARLRLVADKKADILACSLVLDGLALLMTWFCWEAFIALTVTLHTVIISSNFYETSVFTPLLCVCWKVVNVSPHRLYGRNGSNSSASVNDTDSFCGAVTRGHFTTRARQSGCSFMVWIVSRKGDISSCSSWQSGLKGLQRNWGRRDKGEGQRESDLYICTYK